MFYQVNGQNYLAHHGRKGQKWGILNGPPYPLSGANKIRAEAGYARNRVTEKLSNASAKVRKAETAKTETAKTETRKAETRKAETAKTETRKAETAKTEIPKDEPFNYKKEADALQSQINYYTNQKKLKKILDEQNKNSGLEFTKKFGKATLDDVVAPAVKAVAKDWLENKLREVTNTPKQQGKKKK